eukprot:11740870-Ditylum_brightwellii.AAC.2
MAHPEEDLLLGNKILKVLDSTTKDLLTTEDMNSGCKLFNAIQTIATTMHTQQEIDKLQQKWHALKQKPQESFQDYATRAKKLAEEFDNTSINITRAEIGH